MPLLEQIHSPTQLRALAEEVLPQVCHELRQEIIAVCGKVGGHLGASLGAVELIVALHRIFKSPVDRLVFDVGHQAYAHKILTGRRDRMMTLRAEGGIAPFLDVAESEHDAFGAGHACTALSAAIGIFEGKAKQGQAGRVIAILGDGSLTGGLTFEALNNVGRSRLPLVIVLNDNEMSITANVGAVPAMLKASGSARAFFEALGLTYLGPVDGHSLPALLDAFREARRSHRPLIVHVRTEKGHGFAPAEADANTRGHAMGPYEWRDGKLVRSRAGQKTFSEEFAEALERRMAEDQRIVAVTPAMLEGSALGPLRARFPSRVYDVGIAEQHAVTFSAGLAMAGMKPVCCIYSTFLQRAYDQVIHDVCIPRLSVVFAIDRAGLVGSDGATHQGSYDLSFLRVLPGMRLMAPAVEGDLGEMLDVALSAGGPAAVRFPRSTVPSKPEGWPEAAPATGARWLQRIGQAELSIIGLGPLVLAALAAARGMPWNVLDARFLAPLDEGAIREAAACGRVLTVEEGTRKGGLGGALLEFLAEVGAVARVRTLGLPDAFVRHGDARAQRLRLGLSAEGIRRAAQEMQVRES